MLNFDFYNPTRIVFGSGTVNRLDELVPTQARVLLLYGGQSALANGTLGEVREALGSRVVQEFGGIEPNPSYETLIQAVDLVRSHRLDFLLAVGGGSVIDGTKFVAAAVGYDGDAWDILETRGANIRQALPFGCVLTLPATGSEMNQSAVVTRRATQAKLPFRSPHVFPRFSILDPSKTYTLPVRQLANGVADAFTHVMEQYLTYPVDARVQDRFAEGLLQTLIEIAPRVLEESTDYGIRANLVWSATLALNGLIGAGVPQDWSTHMIGHELTALHGIDHARTLAIVLPANLQVRRQAKRDKLLQYAARVWQITEGDEEQRIDAAIERTRGFFESLGLPTHLTAYQLGSQDIDALIGQLEAHRLTELGETSDVSLAVSRRILEASL
ncbi:TPA: iron-containing alcohol dehydrogenase [Pseudomonas aeruginosa]|uniref:iron-containing alcohol dehydrogenase n=1 Tax=Pseudomonas citronellolis TaxID=53408 RepID=UPI001A193D9B|nr:iron-containing alcohol dehydrogenase [Pseudomonas citronellolis]MBH3547442.1 iron-containing alcohol dehydrogenase [Pseudomonas aeruginosa]UUC47468.1 iron-containing alcohol dehydrogenase [Pseudomonas citronellolis]HBN9703296.1 iron-containing alcohol dehydrogenase [Pseudomonas aeruginosa]HBN9721844.1 iron-containing alcohol dehydrogenase [Pseudomonas aeruginosa]HBN9767923.1 iron-containing alcohol dehydrogenase [Pseudomonas aeruginosa]